MTHKQRAGHVRALLLRLEQAEQQSHALGLHEAAHAINAAKNAVGRGFSNMKKAHVPMSTTGEPNG